MVACAARRSLDRDGSGKITISELQESLAGLGVPIDTSTAERMVDMIDVDGSSDISFQEFRRFAILLPKSQVILSIEWYCSWNVCLQNVRAGRRSAAVFLLML